MTATVSFVCATFVQICAGIYFFFVVDLFLEFFRRGEEKEEEVSSNMVSFLLKVQFWNWK